MADIGASSSGSTAPATSTSSASTQLNGVANAQATQSSAPQQSTAGSATTAPDATQSQAPAQPGQAPAAQQGQAAAPNADGTQAAVNGQGEQPPATNPLMSDPATAEWLRSKGIDPANPDFSKIVENARNAERALTQQRQHKQIAETLQNTEQVLANPQEQQELSPLDEFEQAHAWQVQNACSLLGVESLEELAQVNPQLASKLEKAYLIGQQKAWQESQKWEQGRQAREVQRQQQIAEFQAKAAEAEQTYRNNLLQAKANYPELETHMEKYGINKFLTALEDAWVVPRQMLLADPAVAQQFAKITKALDLLENLDAHRDNWTKEYEKSLKKQSEAVLPSAVAGQQAAPAGKAGFGAGAQRVGSGASII